MLHIIYTEDAVLLSKRAWSSWREIQDAFLGYKASLGPWAAEETARFLQSEYSDLRPSADMQVRYLQANAEETVTVTFGAGDGAAIG